jgi:hypothetical protein
MIRAWLAVSRRGLSRALGGTALILALDLPLTLERVARDQLEVLGERIDFLEVRLEALDGGQQLLLGVEPLPLGFELVEIGLLLLDSELVVPLDGRLVLAARRTATTAAHRRSDHAGAVALRALELCVVLGAQVNRARRHVTRGERGRTGAADGAGMAERRAPDASDAARVSRHDVQSARCDSRLRPAKRQSAKAYPVRPLLWTLWTRFSLLYIALTGNGAKADARRSLALFNRGK